MKDLAVCFVAMCAVHKATLQKTPGCMFQYHLTRASKLLQRNTTNTQYASGDQIDHDNDIYLYSLGYLECIMFVC